MSSYLITDYDNNNFTVAQALFNNTGSPDLVPIPWNATTTHDSRMHLSEGSIAGISIGAILLAFIILVIPAVLVRRKRLRRERVQNYEDKWGMTEEVRNEKARSLISTQEIGPSSICGNREHPQELHNTYQVELLDHKSPSGSGQRVKELLDEHCLPGSGNTPCELLDENSPSGSGKEVKELSDQRRTSGSGNEICELPDENNQFGSDQGAKELSGRPRSSGSGNEVLGIPNDHGVYSSDRYIDLPYSAEQSPDSDTSQRKSSSTLTTQASTRTSFGVLFDPRRRITKSSTVDRSSRTSSMKNSKSSKTSSTKTTSSYHSLHHRVDLNKKLPQIPQDAVKMAIPVSIHSYHPRTRGRIDTTSANVILPKKAFTYDRPQRSRVHRQASRLP